MSRRAAAHGGPEKATAMSPLPTYEAGKVLDNYRIDAPVAESGMAAIFRATDLRDGRRVALKIPHFAMEADPALFDRFKREEAIGIALDHPNVMRIYADDERTRVYMVMEWVEGRLLRQVMFEAGKMPVERAVHITLGILKALEYIHKNGVVHRDLKPENIMLDPQDGIKLIDFGIASQEGAKRLTYAGFTQTMGSPDYISPEQVKGKRGDARSDIYSVGYHALRDALRPHSFQWPIAARGDERSPDQSSAAAARGRAQHHAADAGGALDRALERDPKTAIHRRSPFAQDLEHLDQVGIAERNELTDWKNRRSMQSRKIFYYIALALIPFALFFVMYLLARHHR